MASPLDKLTSVFPCPVCGMEFQRQDHLKRHVFLHEDYKPFACSKCRRHFSRRCV
ncbi:transcription factor steA [Colletotrichum asianum]|uniref:Transcription factor steA n=1 Tax=Colletotrichum asianum TaxID=702518 RepID=A0A8H3WQ26_9PEZI|nr:transcription factor steA [Colletotrichum asianum]